MPVGGPVPVSSFEPARLKGEARSSIGSNSPAPLDTRAAAGQARTVPAWIVRGRSCVDTGGRAVHVQVERAVPFRSWQNRGGMGSRMHT